MRLPLSKRKPNKGFSLRARLMLGAVVITLLFMLALMPALQRVFMVALEESIEQRLAADTSAIISATRVVNGQLLMPQKLPDEEYDQLSSRQLAMIYDQEGNLLWQSSSINQEQIDYVPRYDGQGHEFLRTKDQSGREFFIYDLEINLLRGKNAALSIITMQPVSDYKHMFRNLRRHLIIGLGASMLILVGFLWLGLSWGISSLRNLSAELDEVESGGRDALSDHHPRELLRLTRSLNRLLESERLQSERYRNSLDDLAHSLKTPLTVLQGATEVISKQPSNREQARTLQTQISRMSQQISYQLQRASLRKSGLVRHRVILEPLLDSLLEALNKVYRDKQVYIEKDFSASFTLPLEKEALLELLGNLLENAYRLCLGHIKVSGQIMNGHYELRVEDDGPGVPYDQRERILQRGERLDTQFPGQGIGTAVVKDIIASYHGQLYLEDSALGGAAFRMTFPLH